MVVQIFKKFGIFSRDVGAMQMQVTNHVFIVLQFVRYRSDLWLDRPTRVIFVVEKLTQIVESYLWLGYDLLNKFLISTYVAIAEVLILVLIASIDRYSDEGLSFTCVLAE